MKTFVSRGKIWFEKENIGTYIFVGLNTENQFGLMSGYKLKK